MLLCEYHQLLINLKQCRLSSGRRSSKPMQNTVLHFFCRKLDGCRYGGVFKFGQPLLLVRDPELIKTVLVKEFNSFHDNDFESDPEVDPLFGRNPFLLTGER